MLFRYYFFKKGSRSYEVTDLLSYFSANPYISISDKNENLTVAHYFNPVLNFNCDFVIGNKSIVPGIERLNPSYVDVNLWVEFSVLLPTYCVSLIINIIEDICKLFNFYVYNEVFQDVESFKKSIMLKAFEVVKLAYKKSYPEEVYHYYRLDSEKLSYTYDFLQQRAILIDLFKDDDVNVPSINYYAVEGKRSVYLCVTIDLEKAFLYPGFVDVVYLKINGNYLFISADEFYMNIKKYLHTIESSLNNLYYVNNKDMKKINKILSKATFSPLILQLNEVEFKKVLDI